LAISILQIDRVNDKRRCEYHVFVEIGGGYDAGELMGDIYPSGVIDESRR
jgi:hypothetical protein